MLIVTETEMSKYVCQLPQSRQDEIRMDSKVCDLTDTIEIISVDDDALCVLLATDDDQETYEYEYGNIVHAKEHYEQEEHATLYQYNNGSYQLLERK